MKQLRYAFVLAALACSFGMSGQLVRDPSGYVSETSLRANLTYIASDELEGRASPSPGLEKAAQYIAQQFQAAGLVQVNGSYFQEATDHRLNQEGMPVLKNVVGLLRGSDPVLADTYLLVTAHYDHVGTRPNSEAEDKIFNGANDDGSGTVAVIEIAKALVAAGAKPKRSVLFVCVFGEERGMQGSTYYGEHPLFPLTKTVGMLNIEMIGRTNKYSAEPTKRRNKVIEDWSGKLGVTGFDYSDMGTRLVESCAKAGIEALKDPDASGPFFMRSDNRAMAGFGIPAHTVSVGYEDPEYHQANDHADTINYTNMVKVVRALVHATLDLANDAVAPKWAEIPETQRYRDAHTKLHGG
ncbi:MAG: M20/M25/M40 family metallo-hydrolase [Fimbriimonadaceae bacterium]